ncbi:putative lipoprotein [Hallella multisaccharivorax DSM 17128]|uniref:Putative lipoprotein n=2 Tax=Hallella multisaccharivorax TaxID=310514 RepID=F8N5C1_9BACT|nr:putative lipoprotein [Hallella multisaccharivorax DSM 17128]
MRHKKLLFLTLMTFFLTACHRATLEDMAAKTASDYTERYCPTPVEDFQRTDSITFDRGTHTFSYYYTLTGKIDDPAVIEKGEKQILATIIGSLKENTSMKDYKQAGYNFRYVYRSQKNGNVMIDKTFKQKDYK